MGIFEKIQGIVGIGEFKKTPAQQEVKNRIESLLGMERGTLRDSDTVLGLKNIDPHVLIESLITAGKIEGSFIIDDVEKLTIGDIIRAVN